MLSIVPLIDGGGLFETGALAVPLPKHGSRKISRWILW
ncbi:NADP-dependent isocitrate dehydrogenase [Vibrio lentus]|nr:NADP-dependent isocitrate dehydrogenase [Vibrio lentus]